MIAESGPAGRPGRATARHRPAWLNGTGAQVRVLPPVVFAVPLGLAAWLHRRRPLPAHATPVLLRALGVALACAGAVLMLWAFLTLRARGTTVVPWAPVRELVTDGPFARVRNPIYSADLLIYLGVSLRMGSWWPLLALPAVLGVLHRWVITPEEQYLSKRFARTYPPYADRVPALVPRLR